MGERNKVTEAIILSIRTMGENNRSVQVLSPDFGLFYATLYGGAKSKMRSLVQLFNSGTLYIYEDSAKDARKITDFDVTDCHLSFRENLYKMWAASFASELICKTRCAGDYKNSFILLKAFLSGTDKSDEKGARLGMLRFLWRYIGLLGIQPSVEECSVCGAPLFSLQSAANSSHVFLQSGFACHSCSASLYADNPLVLSGEALAYLALVSTASPRVSREMRLSDAAATEIKALVYTLCQNACETRLKTLESGAGIL